MAQILCEKDKLCEAQAVRSHNRLLAFLLQGTEAAQACPAYFVVLDKTQLKELNFECKLSIMKCNQAHINTLTKHS